MSTTTETASAQPPRAASAGSDVEDGEVTESDNDAVIMVEPPKAVAIAEERRSSDQEANKKRVVISEESGTIDLTKPEISGSSKLARKRQNRSIRKHQEQTEKVYLVMEVLLFLFLINTPFLLAESQNQRTDQTTGGRRNGRIRNAVRSRCQSATHALRSGGHLRQASQRLRLGRQRGRWPALSALHVPGTTRTSSQTQSPAPANHQHRGSKSLGRWHLLLQLSRPMHGSDVQAIARVPDTA